MIKSKKIFIFALTSLVGAAGFLYFLKNNNLGTNTIIIESERVKDFIFEDMEPEVDIYPTNPLSGIKCENYNRRPYAVILAEDHEARPLSGIGLADLIIEMPVVTGSITRMMAVFVCNSPEEIGSIRSARHDFIPLALGYDAVFAHWGGSKSALDELRGGIINNLDALPNYFNTFYRKRWIPAPHNGFTNMERMISAAEKLGYRMTLEFEGYRFIENSKHERQPGAGPPQAENPKQILNSKSTIPKITIGYKYPYNVRYEYSPESNSYLRWRGGMKEEDKLSGEQVEAKNIVVIVAFSRQIGGGYNDVDILGTGKATVYSSGEEVRGVWVKKRAEDVLRFYNEGGEEIEFVPGNIWIEVVEPSTEVVYE